MRRVDLVFLLLVLALIGAVAVVAAGRGDPLDEPVHDRPPLGLPEGPLHADDLDALQFSVGLRGYRMDQVDAVLDRVQSELAARDQRIGELEAELEARQWRS